MTTTIQAPVALVRDGNVARIILNRPEAANAIDIATANALLDTVLRVEEDDTVRCVVLTGAGRLFCGGGDVAAFRSAGDALPTLLKQLTGPLHAAISRMLRMPKPLVVAVNGTAAGAGLGLSLIGDIVIAVQSAKFVPAYGAIGLTADGGLTWLLPRLIGMRRAQEMMMTNRSVSAEEAVRWGLITRAVEAEVFEQDIQETAERLATSPVRAIGRLRSLLLSSHTNAVETQMELEAATMAQCGRDVEAQEGIAAMFEKRKADFSLL